MTRPAAPNKPLPPDPVTPVKVPYACQQIHVSVSNCFVLASVATVGFSKRLLATVIVRQQLLAVVGVSKHVKKKIFLLVFGADQLIINQWDLLIHVVIGWLFRAW